MFTNFANQSTTLYRSNKVTIPDSFCQSVLGGGFMPHLGHRPQLRKKKPGVHNSGQFYVSINFLLCSIDLSFLRGSPTSTAKTNQPQWSFAQDLFEQDSLQSQPTKCQRRKTQASGDGHVKHGNWNSSMNGVSRWEIHRTGVGVKETLQESMD